MKIRQIVIYKRAMTIQEIIIRGAMHMVISSWKRSLHAYGRRTCEICAMKTTILM